MNPRMVAAQFAAYTWYMEQREGRARIAEALRFARRNWRAFRAGARTGLGRLLIRLARARRKARWASEAGTING